MFNRKKPKATTGPLAPRLPFWEFATRICGLGQGDSKIRFTVAQAAIWKSIDRRIALTDDEAAAYRELTGKAPWKVGSRAPFFICSTLTRGGGKSLLLAHFALYECLTNPYVAAAGETVAVVALAPRVKQSRDMLGYARAALERESLSPLVEKIAGDEIILRNGRFLRIQAVDKSGGAARGPTYLATVFDESAFLGFEGKIIDRDQWQAILAGARGVSEFRGVLSSTPNGKAGFFWSTFDEYFGKENASWEVFKGPVDLVRPDMDKAFLQEFQRADEDAFLREFCCSFDAGTGAARFFVAGQVESAIMAGVVSIEPSGPLSSYTCAVDPSGGAHDVFTCVIVERMEDGTLRQVLARGWDPKEKPITVHEIAKEIAELVAPYGINAVYGDVFGGNWVAEAFAAVGLQYQTRGFNGQQKVQRAAALRESFQSGRLKLLDIADQTRELCEYEQKTLPSGQVSVNHPNTKTGSDDYLDALALAHWETLGHFEELHPPEGLAVLYPAKKLREELYNGGRYPEPQPARYYLDAKEIADFGPGPAWILANWSKSVKHALAAPAELAYWAGLDGPQWMISQGEDLILQHVWMRWVLASTSEGFEGRQWFASLGQFPGIPAWKEIQKTVLIEGLDAIVTFKAVEAPRSENQTPGNWPFDLFQSAYERGSTPACPPWRAPNPRWRVFPLDKWPMIDWKGDRRWKRRIDAVFSRGRTEFKERVDRLEQLKTSLGGTRPKAETIFDDGDEYSGRCW